MALQIAANSFFMQLHLLFPGQWPYNVACSILACQPAPSRLPMVCILEDNYEQNLTILLRDYEFFRIIPLEINILPFIHIWC